MEIKIINENTTFKIDGSKLAAITLAQIKRSSIIITEGINKLI